MREFKVGDKVRVSATVMTPAPADADNYIGRVGTVAYVGIDVGVDFGEGFPGHNISGSLLTNTGWYLAKHEVELVKTKPRIRKSRVRKVKKVVRRRAASR